MVPGVPSKCSEYKPSVIHLGARAFNYHTRIRELSKTETTLSINDGLHNSIVSYPKVDEPTVKYLVGQSRILAKEWATPYHWSRSNEESYKRGHNDIFLSNRQGVWACKLCMRNNQESQKKGGFLQVGSKPYIENRRE
jgi:hypothetical protein